jgi:hypothetical protein
MVGAIRKRKNLKISVCQLIREKKGGTMVRAAFV